MLLIDNEKQTVEIQGDMDRVTTDLFNLFVALARYGITEKEIIRCVAMAYVMLKKLEGDADDTN